MNLLRKHFGKSKILVPQPLLLSRHSQQHLHPQQFYHFFRHKHTLYTILSLNGGHPVFKEVLNSLTVSRVTLDEEWYNLLHQILETAPKGIQRSRIVSIVVDVPGMLGYH